MATIPLSNVVAGAPMPRFMQGVPVSGAAGSQLGAPKGAQLTNTLTGIVYVNEGTVTVPQWNVLGAQA